jgi:hypothetical protein
LTITACGSSTQGNTRAVVQYTFRSYGNLGDLEFVERSNKIRVEKLLNGLPIILGEYNAPTVGAKCILYNIYYFSLQTQDRLS